jgi:formyltetrahydrofolate-dependent phosphoribosylglycinamide formyltransferase
MRRKRVAILISGRGSNMMSLIEAARRPDYPAEIVLVIANRADAGGIERARLAGVPAIVVPSRDYRDRALFEAELTRQIEAANVEIVCLAGFMRVLTPAFVGHWRDRLINIHPSLLPAFPGLDTHGRALAAGVTEHGCTVHFVREGVDDGPVIAQSKVAVLAGDTPEGLAARVLEAEHRLYPAALALVASGAAASRDYLSNSAPQAGNH